MVRASGGASLKELEQVIRTAINLLDRGPHGVALALLRADAGNSGKLPTE